MWRTLAAQRRLGSVVGEGMTISPFRPQPCPDSVHAMIDRWGSSGEVLSRGFVRSMGRAEAEICRTRAIKPTVLMSIDLANRDGEGEARAW